MNVFVRPIVQMNACMYVCACVCIYPFAHRQWNRNQIIIQNKNYWHCEYTKQTKQLSFSPTPGNHLNMCVCVLSSSLLEVPVIIDCFSCHSFLWSMVRWFFPRLYPHSLRVAPSFRWIARYNRISNKICIDSVIATKWEMIKHDVALAIYLRTYNKGTVQFTNIRTFALCTLIWANDTNDSYYINSHWWEMKKGIDKRGVCRMQTVGI